MSGGRDKPALRVGQIRPSVAFRLLPLSPIWAARRACPLNEFDDIKSVNNANRWYHTPTLLTVVMLVLHCLWLAPY